MNGVVLIVDGFGKHFDHQQVFDVAGFHATHVAALVGIHEDQCAGGFGGIPLTGDLTFSRAASHDARFVEKQLQRVVVFQHVDPVWILLGMQDADAVFLITEWNEFKQLDMARVRDLMRQPILLDGRNVYDPQTMREMGFIYRGMGRGYSGEALR